MIIFFLSGIITTKTFWRKSRGNVTLTNLTSTLWRWPVGPNSPLPRLMQNCQNFPEFSHHFSQQSKKSRPLLHRRIGVVGKAPKPGRLRPPLRDPSLIHPYSTPRTHRPRVRYNLQYPSRFLLRLSQHFAVPIPLPHRWPQRIHPPSLTSGHNPSQPMTSSRLTKSTNIIIYLLLTIHQKIRNSQCGPNLRLRKAFTCLHNSNNSMKSSINRNVGWPVVGKLQPKVTWWVKRHVRHWCRRRQRRCHTGRRQRQHRT